MSTYSIHYIEQLTGIKAHTVRIWEQRYNIITPTRSKTNIRSYSDEQLKKLLNISTLLYAGYKIGNLAKMNDEEILSIINSFGKTPTSESIQLTATLNSFISSTLTYDEELFHLLYSDSIKRYGIETTYQQLLYPLLIRIGTLWNVNDLIPSQEHFTINLIKQKLFSAAENIGFPSSDELWILFLPENEEHEIGLLFANLMLRMYGKRTLYLGQKMPIDNLTHIIESTHPTGFLYFQVKHLPKETSKKYLETIEKHTGEISKIVCAQKGIFEGISVSENTKVIDDPTTFINWLKSNSNE
jgi:DNA-binding transcriptional MerR regulator